MTDSLTILPTELLKNIFQHTLPTDISNLRLVSWRLESIATEERFRQFTVRATVRGVEKLKRVCATHRLKICVKHLKYIGLMPEAGQEVCKTSGTPKSDYSDANSLRNASPGMC